MLVGRQRKETVFDALRMGECEQEKIEKKEREKRHVSSSIELK
jgi:hypothetical protein